MHTLSHEVHVYCMSQCSLRRMLPKLTMHVLAAQTLQCVDPCLWCLPASLQRVSPGRRQPPASSTSTQPEGVGFPCLRWPDHLEFFLRAAVQGSGLEITTIGHPTEEDKRQRQAMYESLIQSVGAQIVPVCQL
jgi:hypothetical protein